MNRQKIIRFHTEPSIRYKVSGVYMIRFGSKYFYIGCSKDVTNRIRTHTVDILYGKSCIRGIKAMNGFTGKITFLLLEEVNKETHGDDWYKELFFVEKKHINARKRSKYCLNLRMPRKGIGGLKIPSIPCLPCRVPNFNIAK